MRKSMKRLGAAALTLAMVGASMSSFAWAEEEQTYDFGGQEVTVYGNKFNDLNPDTTNDVATALDAAAQIEEKYNIKFVYSSAEENGFDGYNMGEVVQTTVTSGKGFANIIDVGPEGILPMINGGYVVDFTDQIDDLHIGSVYTDAVTWAGRTYGFSTDNIGDTYTLIYSRDYLDEIGMDVTPTEKFMAGEWSYDDVREYFTEMKAKLPEGVYPIGVHYFHWQSMAGAANGAPAISSDGVNITNPDYLESLEFYRSLIDDGLAAPIVTEFNEDGKITGQDAPSGPNDMNERIVITRAESWELQSYANNFGNIGITYWPWGSAVTVDGDYTTLSDNYRTAQSYWGNVLVLSDAEEQTGIDPFILLQIAKDYYDLLNPAGAAARLAAYEAEQAGEVPVIGFEAGMARSFSTPEDVELFDWGHGRVVYEWSKAFDDAGVFDTWSVAMEIIAYGNDARSVAESYYQEGLTVAIERGFLSEEASEE